MNPVVAGDYKIRYSVCSRDEELFKGNADAFLQMLPNIIPKRLVEKDKPEGTVLSVVRAGVVKYQLVLYKIPADGNNRTIATERKMPDIIFQSTHY